MEKSTIGNELLKVDRRGHVRVPRVRREALLDEYERQGVSAAEFAAHIGVKCSTFYHWKRCRDRKRAAAELEPDAVSIEALAPVTRSAWIEAVAASSVASESGSPSCSPDDRLPILLPGGARMEVSHRGQLPLAVRLLEMLGRQGGGSC